jgi:hypothetical protein
MSGDTGEHLASYVYIGMSAIISLYILIAAYIHSKKVPAAH